MWPEALCRQGIRKVRFPPPQTPRSAQRRLRQIGDSPHRRKDRPRVGGGLRKTGKRVRGEAADCPVRLSDDAMSSSNTCTTCHARTEHADPGAPIRLLSGSARSQAKGDIRSAAATAEGGVSGPKHENLYGPFVPRAASPCWARYDSASAHTLLSRDCEARNLSRCGPRWYL